MTASNNKPNQFFFIVGHPRSGTSLLSTLLNRHSKLCVTPETSILLRSSAKKLGLATRHRDLNYIHENIGWLNIAPSSVEQLIPQKNWNKYSMLKAMLDAFAHSTGKSIVGEKTPWHLESVDKLIHYYPGCRVIGIVRDGRDCVNSMLKMPGNYNPWYWHSQSWVRASRLMARWKNKFPDAINVIRYVDLLLDPIKSMQAISQHLGVEFERNQLDPDADSAVRLEWETWKANIGSKIDSSRSFAWRDHSDICLMSNMTRIMRSHLIRWGYDVADNPNTIQAIGDNVYRKRLFCARIARGALHRIR